MPGIIASRKVQPEPSSKKKPASSSNTPRRDSLVVPNRFGRYVVERTLGKGTFGKVVLGKEPMSGDQVAIKIIDQASVKTPREKKNVAREIRLMKILTHPHIIQVYDVIETKDYTTIFMEHASGGELHELVSHQKGLPEDLARKYFRQIVSAVDYCHESSIVHRDLKPENCLIDASGNIKLIDFGFGNTYTRGNVLNTYCGSPFYAAPEMTQGVEYCGPEVDLWSLGVILYMMLTGSLPFNGANIAELYEAIASGNYYEPQQGVSKGALALVRSLLTVKPNLRATMEDVKQHPWTNYGYREPIDNHVPPRANMLYELDEETLAEVHSLGYGRQEYFNAFRNQTDKSPVKSLYHLHSEWIQRRKLEKAQETSELALAKLAIHTESFTTATATATTTTILDLTSSPPSSPVSKTPSQSLKKSTRSDSPSSASTTLDTEPKQSFWSRLRLDWLSKTSAKKSPMLSPSDALSAQSQDQNTKPRHTPDALLAAIGANLST